MKIFQLFVSSITLVLIVFSFFIYYYDEQKIPKIYWVYLKFNENDLKPEKYQSDIILKDDRKIFKT